MNLLAMLKNLLGNPPIEDDILIFYLDMAKNIICSLRNTEKIEEQYKPIQVYIAVELFNKLGIEGQITHSENGINRIYEKGLISPSLLNLVTPSAKTPISKKM